ncbi:integral membrane protein 2C isoform 1-T3 [Ciconia maguari]
MFVKPEPCHVSVPGTVNRSPWQEGGGFGSVCCFTRRPTPWAFHISWPLSTSNKQNITRWPRASCCCLTISFVSKKRKEGTKDSIHDSCSRDQHVTPAGAACTPSSDKKFSSVQLQMNAVTFHGNYWIDSLPLATAGVLALDFFSVMRVDHWTGDKGGGAGSHGAGPEVIAQRGVLSDHGSPRTAPGLGLCIDLPRESMFHCGVLYEDSLYSPFKGQLELHEDVKIYIEENYEQINVPVPQFGGSDPADIIHDFQRGLTAYHDITLDKCYVIELNTTIVMPPRNLWELLVNVKKGTYLPQTYIIQEEMIATEHVSDMEQLGSFIYRLCSGKETYRLKRRSVRRRISRREAGNCHRIRHFENTFVVETVICKKS